MQNCFSDAPRNVLGVRFGGLSRILGHTKKNLADILTIVVENYPLHSNHHIEFQVLLD
jgi:hypothetical protein